MNEDWVQEIVKNVATAVAEQIKNVQVDLGNYYTKTEVDEIVSNVNVDLTDARVDIWVYKPDGHLVMKAVDKDNIDLDNSTCLLKPSPSPRDS